MARSFGYEYISYLLEIMEMLHDLTTELTSNKAL